jgi:putative ABC transport system substrate-binding protein
VLEPSTARAAQPVQQVVRVGFVAPYDDDYTAFWERLRELGWVEGRNLIIEARRAEGHLDRLSALMADVVGREVDVIVTVGTPAALAGKNATSTTPIVVAAMGDPIGSGLAASLARPGGNPTGLSLEYGEDMTGKWLEHLQETVPRLSTVAVIANPDLELVRRWVKQLEVIAPRRGLQLEFIWVREPELAFDRYFRQRQRQAQAILVLSDPFTFQIRRQIATAAARHRLPDMYMWLGYMDSGGLMAYGVDPPSLYRRAADYVDRILKGAKPADLPIEQPTKFKLVVNLKTAKVLGLKIPESILLRADEIIR